MLFSKPSQGSLSLILDIQSSIIRASLVHSTPGSIPRIVFTFAKNIHNRPGSGSAKIVHTTLTALKESMGGVYQFMNLTKHSPEFPKKISDAHFVLSTPWVISQARTIVKKFGNGVEVTEKVILDTISAERKHLVSPDLGDANGLTIIEEKIFNVRLNGYPVHSWKGKKTTELEISFSVSLAGTHTADLFRETCALVPKSKIYFHSSLNLQCVALRQLMPHQSAYTLVHVHGELTDVAVISHNSCVFFGSYPLGVYGVLRKIAKAGNSHLEVADSSINLYMQKSYDGGHPSKDIIAVEEGIRAWSAEFKNLFLTSHPQITLPAHITLCGHAHEDLFARSVKVAYPQLEPRLLTTEDLKPFVRYDVPEEPARLMGLYTMAIHSMHEESVVQ
jgi:hypothetical protein